MFKPQDWDRFVANAAESIVTHAPDLEEPLKGLKAYREPFERNVEAFPDQHIETRQAFGQRTLGSQGRVRTQTLRAFDNEDMERILAQMP